MDNIDKNAWRHEILNRLRISGVPEDQLPDNPVAAVSMLARALLAELPSELKNFLDGNFAKPSWPTGTMILRRSDIEFSGGACDRPDGKKPDMEGMPPVLRLTHKDHGTLNIFFNDSVVLNRFINAVHGMQMARMFPTENKKTE